MQIQATMQRELFHRNLTLRQFEQNRLHAYMCVYAGKPLALVITLK